jgi:hypothetical protein
VGEVRAMKFSERLRAEAADFEKRLDAAPSSPYRLMEYRIRADMRRLFAEIHERFDALEAAKP